MDSTRIAEAVLDELVRIAESQPNERLPKEEQIRCRIYTTLIPLFRFVCAERGYGSIDERSRIECDLWASSPDQVPIWMEIKRCWSVSGWVNKPPEQLAYWDADLDKLRKLPVKSERFFFLVGFFDFDPLDEEKSPHGGVVQNIRRYHPDQLLPPTSRQFSWRAGDGSSWAGVWVWHWHPDVEVKIGA